MKYDAQRALELLRLGTANPKAEFRAGQEDAIREVVSGSGRALVVQRTGWGKSFVYFIAAKLLRESGLGPAILVSPLIALMRNQQAAAKRMGVVAATLNSTNKDDWDAIADQIKQNRVDLVLMAPERFKNDFFAENVLPDMARRVSLLIVDEAHCISDWGHDFRPDYRLLKRYMDELPKNMRLLATTATAPERVIDDLRAVLGAELHVSRGDLSRPSLTLQTIRLDSRAERLAWLAEQLPLIEGSGVVYALTIRDVAIITKWLKSRGLNVDAYSGQTEAERRPELEDALLSNKVKALVATSALGMGFDKPDLGFVIHFQAPSNVIAYYQQVGRAGRAVEKAYGVLLSGREDDKINDYFIDTALPSREEARQVLEALNDAENGLSLGQLQEHVNLKQSRLDFVLKTLALESPAPVVLQDGKWTRTVEDLSDAFWERGTALSQSRKVEQQQMKEYVALKSGHMEFLLKALDSKESVELVAQLPQLPSTPSNEQVKEAIEYLGWQPSPIEPRKQWPTSGLPLFKVKGKIPQDQRAEEGKALSIWRDGALGSAVAEGKYKHEHFGDDLVEAAVRLMHEWSPQPAPTWVTAIPSVRRPKLVPDLARRLAAKLGLPYVEALVKIVDRPEQKSMQNSFKQARNVDGSLDAPNGVPSGPVLLVDDVVDSRWTITVASWLLRSKGAGPVFPLALAQHGSGE